MGQDTVDEVRSFQSIHQGSDTRIVLTVHVTNGIRVPSNNKTKNINRAVY